MIYSEFVMQIAVHILEVWLLSLGFRIIGNFDPTDPACQRDYGPHRVWTVQAKVPDGVVVDRGLLLARLQAHLDEQARLPGAIRFNAYDIELYESPHCGSYVFVSIEHTA